MKRFRPFKPINIEEKDLDNLKYPIYLQPKWDSIRVCILKGRPLSYALKPIPNKHVQDTIKELYYGLSTKPYLLEGELVLKGERAFDFQANQSAFMSREGCPPFEIILFDCIINPEDHVSYWNRWDTLLQYAAYDSNLLKSVSNHVVHDKEEVLKLENEYIEKGFEGIVLKSISGKYKTGRATLKEASCMKLKRFQDAEAQLLDIEPLNINLNEPELDNHGLQKRSHKLEGKVPSNLAGSLVVRAINGHFAGKTFRIGSGMSDVVRKTLWAKKEFLVNSRPILTFKYQQVGSDEKPRMPIFKGFRED